MSGKESSNQLRKQFMLAVAMVVLAIVVGTASTFAWFASGTNAEARNMAVTVKAGSMFLQIKGTGGTAGTGSITGDGNDFDTDGAVVMTGVELRPTAHEALANNAAITAAKADPATDTANWYYRYSGDTGTANYNMSEKYAVPVADFGDYVAAITYQVRIVDGTEVTEVYDLYVQRITLPNKTGIRAIVAGADRYQEFAAVSDNSAARGAAVQVPNASPVSLSDTVTTTPQTVTVYLYVDGNNENVTTQNLLSLLGDVELSMYCYDNDTL